MSVLTPVVDSWDGPNRRIYLKLGVTDYYPIEDIYHEYRNQRRLNEELRKYEPLLRAEGNVPKGGGAFTPRYVVLLDGTKIVPANDTLQINQLGDMITNTPDTDPSLYDISQLTVAKPIYIKPSEAETIQLNSESIVYSSFQGAVWVDSASPYSDIGSASLPNGNRERPVNSMALAVQIGATRGFKTIGLLSNYTLNSATNVEGFEIFGPSHVNTKIVILDSALTEAVTFRDLNVEGVLDGNSEINSCMIGDLAYVNGHIHDSSLYGTITLGGGADAVIGNGSVVRLHDLPIIDMGGTGQDLIMTDWSGHITIKNMAGTNDVSIGLDSGQIVLDIATVTSGNINVSGIGSIVDSLGNPLTSGLWNGGVTINNLAMSKETIAVAVWDEPIGNHLIAGTTGLSIGRQQFDGKVTIDTVNGSAGTAFPIGTEANPVDNIVDALVIAVNEGIDVFRLAEPLTIASGVDISGFTFMSYNWVELIIEDGVISDDATFTKLTLTTSYLSGTWNVINDCWMYGVYNLAGWIRGGSFTEIFLAEYNVDSLGQTFIDDLLPENGGLTSYLTMNTNVAVAMTNCKDICTVKSMTAGSTLNAGVLGGEVIIDSTCTGGDITIIGIGELTNNSTLEIDVDGLLNKEQITKPNWDKVHIDTVNGEAGTDFPIGTLDTPSNNFDDAMTIAVANNIKTFELDTNITLTQTVSGYSFTGFKNQILDLNSQICIGTLFTHVTLTGTQVSPIRAENCKLSNLQGINGSYKGCVFSDDTPMTLALNSNIFMNNCRSGVPGSDSPIFDFANGGIGFNNRSYSGGVRIINSTDPANIGTFEFVAGKFNFGTDNTEGYFAVRGVVDSTGIDTASTATVVTSGAINSDLVWDKTLADNNIAGTFGGELATKADIASSANTIETTMTAGTIVAGTAIGTFNNTFAKDNNYWQITEDVTTGINVEMTFSVPSADHRAGIFSVFGRYEGLPGTTHFQDLDIYNYETSSWEVLVEEFMPGGNTTDDTFEHEYYERHIDRTLSEVKVRLRHHTTTYNALHNLYLDYVELSFVEVITAEAIAQAVWDETLTGATHNIPTSAGRRLRGISGDVVLDSQVVSATNNTITFNGDASVVDGAYDPGIVSIVEGTGAGQSRLILEYKGSTKTAVVDRNWRVNPDATSECVVISDAGREHVNEGQLQAATSDTATLNSNASVFNNSYNGQVLFLRSGTGEDQARRVKSYDGTTKIATMEKPWASTPDGTTGYVMLPTSILSSAGLADAIWDAQIDDHQITGSMGHWVKKKLLTLGNFIGLK